MEKLAEKIVVELRESQEKALKVVGNTKFDLSIPNQFDIVVEAKEQLICLRNDLGIEKGEIITIQNSEDKKNSDNQIKKIIELRKPIKKIRAEINKVMTDNKKTVLDYFDDVIKETSVIEDAFKLGLEEYKKEKDEEKKLIKLEIFKEVQSQYNNFAFTWKDEYINASREKIESQMLDELNEYKNRMELLELKRDKAELKILKTSKEYEIKEIVTIEDIEHMLDFEGLTVTEIEEKVEDYIISIQQREVRKEEQEQQRQEALKLQEQHKDIVIETENINLKTKTILVSIEVLKEKLEDKKIEIENFLYNDLQAIKYAVKVKGE